MALDRIRITAPLLALAIGATTALAVQQQTQPQQPQQPQPQRDRDLQPDRAAQPMPRPHVGQQYGEKEKELLHRIDDIQGKTVRNLQGERLGDIHSLVIDVEQGMVPFANITTGVLGIGGRLHPVPWEAFQLRPLQNDIYLDVTSDQLENAVSFERNEHPNFGDARWAQQVRDFYASPRQRPGRAGEMDRPMDRDADQPWQRDRDHVRDPGRQVAPGDHTYNGATAVGRFILSNDAIGMDVENHQGDKLGNMSDIVMELRQGEIVYGVVGVGGFLGMGRNHAAVPWHAFNVRGADADDLVWVLNMTEEQLRMATEWDQNRIPKREDAQWAEGQLRGTPGAAPQQPQPRQPEQPQPRQPQQPGEPGTP
jgi:sporulation protein YlmC with PRC-barrel domain